MIDRELLIDGLKQLELDCSKPRLHTVERYITEIQRWNPQYKLVASGDDLIVRHVLDSLAGMEQIVQQSPINVADIGSGAGFPGIPLAIWMDDVNFFLVERSGRRAGFLRNVILNLELHNVSVLEYSVENISKKHKFDVITFRAWTALSSKILRTLTPLLMPHGVIVAYKGQRKTVNNEIQEVQHHFKSTKIVPLHVPFLNKERCLVIMHEHLFD